MDFPSKTVHIIVPGPAGGPGDMTAHIIAPKLAALWGQPVVIDGQPNTDVGLQVAAKAAPDGYTVVIVGGSHYIKPNLYRRLPYDPVKDFAPVSLVVAGFNIVVVHPSVHANTLGELIALAKAKPGHLRYASGGVGSPSHMAGELFKSLAGVDMVHVPYVGHKPAGLALSEGREVQLMFDAMLTAMPKIKSGKWRALAVTTARRAPILPDLPTIAECGVTGYDVSPAMGVFAPNGTPKGVIDKLSAGLAQVLRMPEVKASLEHDGGQPIGSTPEEFAVYVKAAFETWAKVAKDAGIEPAESLPS